MIEDNQSLFERRVGLISGYGISGYGISGYCISGLISGYDISGLISGLISGYGISGISDLFSGYAISGTSLNHWINFWFWYFLVEPVINNQDEEILWYIYQVVLVLLSCY